MRAWRAVLLSLAAAIVASMSVVLPAAADEPGPLIILFDTSGSMSDQDSSGAVKLKTAQAGLSKLVMYQAPGVEMGLWTYPGGEADVHGCNPGRWFPQLAPDDNPDPTDVNAQIRLLTAGGGTPTGPALEAVTSSLRAKGYDSATIVLVSDGESNCGPPPCEVAQEIINSGFNIEVASVAFDIQDQGGSELQCIADVTGGSYTEARDAEALIEELSQYQEAELELDVQAPQRIRSGNTAEFSFTITNPSQQDVSGLTAAISLAPGSRELVPYLPRPRLVLPALPAGESVTRTWLASTSASRTGTVEWRIAVGSEAAGAVAESGRLEVVDSDLSRRDAGALLQSSGGVAVVFGDSYSSGEGAGPYSPEGGECHRSHQSYGAVIGGSDTTVIACSGAVTQNILTAGQRGFPPQSTQLENMGAVPDIGFLTTGGNDIGFEPILRNCALVDCSFFTPTFLAWTKGRADQFAKSYIRLAKGLNTPALLDARDGAIAPLVVSAYPDLFWSPERGTCNVVFNPNEIRSMQAILLQINKQIETAVESARMKGWPVYFADSVVDFGQNHSMCVDDSYFVPVNASEVIGRKGADWLFRTQLGQEMGHPNQAGHRAWANELIMWSQSTKAEPIESLPEPEKRTGFFERIGDTITEWLQTPIFTKPSTATIEVKGPREDGTFVRTEASIQTSPGSIVTVTMTGLAPGSTVVIGIHSEPRTLGNFTVAEDGSLDVTVTIPEDLELGGHTLTGWGLSPDGDLVGGSVPVLVDEPVPLWLALVGGLAAASSVLAGIFFALRAFANRKLRRHDDEQ